MKHLMITALFLFGLTACQLSPPMSDAQRRSMQMRTFENTTYDNVFKAVKTIMQDEGYIIKSQDLAGGLISATASKTDSGSKWMAAFSGNKNYRTGETYEISVNMEKVGKNVETRLTIQKLESYSMGGQQGDVILDENAYRAFYEKVRVEIERRKAQGKG